MILSTYLLVLSHTYHYEEVETYFVHQQEVTYSLSCERRTAVGKKKAFYKTLLLETHFLRRVTEIGTNVLRLGGVHFSPEN